MTNKTKTPDPVDLNAGAHLKALRSWRGISQGELAQKLGLSYQQIQKYERGVNRMSASCLYKISRILEVSVIEFFAGLDGVTTDTGHLWLSEDEIRLLEIYRCIPDMTTRNHVLHITEAVARYRLN